MTQNRTSVAAAPATTLGAVALLGILTLFRLWYGATQTGMVEDETYYWQWSRHLAMSFYDQGPGIAFLIRAGTTLFGDTPLGVRIGPILLGCAAPVTILTPSVTVRRIVNMAALTVVHANAAKQIQLGLSSP